MPEGIPERDAAERRQYKKRVSTPRMKQIKTIIEKLRQSYNQSLRTHFLSWTMLNAAVINAVIMLANVMLRKQLRQVQRANPDMLDQHYWHWMMGLSGIQVFLFAAFFLYSYLLFRRRYTLLGDGHRNADQQESTDSKKEYVLSDHMVRQLMQLWGIILVGVKILDVFFTMLYRNFIASLFDTVDLTSEESLRLFRRMYSNTHAFKYVDMLVAVALGIFITGIFLSDRILKIAAAVLMVLFIAAAASAQMHALTIFHVKVGILWISVFYQTLQTFGLMGFSLYLRGRYRGV